MGSSSSKLEITKSKSGSSEDEFVEDVVCKVQDINENELKTVNLNEHKVLLVKQQGVISALGTKCTHYGAPLVSGALGDGRIRCQWHGACFNVKTGDIEDFPGFDSLPCYQVTIENDNVKVKARKAELVANKRIKDMAKRKQPTILNDKIVVIGGGPAGAICVETLRQEGFQGDIVLVCKENYLPYDRLKATKAMDFDIEKAQFRNDKFYQDNGIEVLKGVEATGVNSDENCVKLSNGKELKYNKLFIATGSKPRTLDVSGSDLKNVLVMRDYDDAQYGHKQLNSEADVVILGGSFIGMEVASYCIGKVKSVTVIGRDVVPFKQVWGERVGSAILKIFEEKGVKYVANSGITKVNDNGQGAVSSVELTSGEKLKCDVLFLGIGVTFYTEFLKNSGVQLMSNGAVEVNEYMQTNDPNVYAGGDIAYAPVWSHGNSKAAIGHFGLAHYHGRKAALNILGKQDPLKSVPFFWTMLFGKSIRYAGHGQFDDVIYSGDVENLKFVAFYLKEDEVVATTACGMDPLVSIYAERLAQGKKLYRKDLQDDPLAWSKSL